MCTDFGTDRMRFAGLIPERVKKSQYDYYTLTAYNNNHEFKNSTVSQYTIMPRNNTIDSMSLDYFLRFEEQ